MNQKPQYNVIKQGSSRAPPSMMVEEPRMEMRQEVSLGKTILPPNLVQQPSNNLTAGLQGINTVEETFALALRTASDPTDPEDTSVWNYNIPTLAANEKQLILDFIGGEYLILQSASPNFPEELFVYCDQITGYSDKNGSPTNVVAIYRVGQVFSIQIGGVMAYTTTLCLKDTLSWPLGTQRQLTFRIGDRNGVYALPLTSTANIEFKIMHVSY